MTTATLESNPMSEELPTVITTAKPIPVVMTDINIPMGSLCNILFKLGFGFICFALGAAISTGIFAVIAFILITGAGSN